MRSPDQAMRPDRRSMRTRTSGFYARKVNESEDAALRARGAREKGAGEKKRRSTLGFAGLREFLRRKDAAEETGAPAPPPPPPRRRATGFEPLAARSPPKRRQLESFLVRAPGGAPRASRD